MRFRWYDKDEPTPQLPGLTQLIRLFTDEPIGKLRIEKYMAGRELQNTVLLIHWGAEKMEAWYRAASLDRRHYTVFVSSVPRTLDTRLYPAAHSIQSGLGDVVGWLADRERLLSLKESFKTGNPAWHLFEPEGISETLIAGYLLLVAEHAGAAIDSDQLGLGPEFFDKVAKAYDKTAAAYGESPCSPPLRYDAIRDLIQKAVKTRSRLQVQHDWNPRA